jgi:hypothetical protein
MYKFDILKVGDFIIESYGEKEFYNLDNGKTLGEWIKQDTEKTEKKDFPLLSSALKVKKNGYGVGVINGIGYLYFDSNNIYKNTNGVCLFSSVFSHGHGINVTQKNINKIFCGFSVRKMISPNWINEKDEYLTPNEKHENFQLFKNDCIVYSLFNNSSEQSSLRQVDYKNQTWDIKNEFFWMSKNQIKELSDQYGYDNLHNDARTSSERYVYKLLFGEERIYDKLSPDAKLVLDKATELVEKSMELRQTMANDENHLDAWDAGYAQLKLVWKEYFQDDFKEFRQLYKNLEDRMRPLVYELGFLMK